MTVGVRILAYKFGADTNIQVITLPFPKTRRKAIEREAGIKVQLEVESGEFIM